jgi:hypothetical protein
MGAKSFFREVRLHLEGSNSCSPTFFEIIKAKFGAHLVCPVIMPNIVCHLHRVWMHMSLWKGCETFILLCSSRDISLAYTNHK